MTAELRFSIFIFPCLSFLFQGEETAELLAKLTSICYTRGGKLARQRVRGGGTQGSAQRGDSEEGGEKGREEGRGGEVSYRAGGGGGGGDRGKEASQGSLRCLSVEYVHLETPQLRVSGLLPCDL